MELVPFKMGKSFYLFKFAVVVVLIGSIVCPPVDKTNPELKDPNDVPKNEIEVFKSNDLSFILLLIVQSFCYRIRE